MCYSICNSIKEQMKHHQQTQNILYCETCSKAFNNPALLARHQYLHKDLKFKCDDCEQQFTFESNPQAHQISHRTLTSYCCVHPKCEKKFKKKGDLACHAKEYDGVLHECPDCSYENPDVCNLESHQLCHSDMKFVCKLCKKTFRFSTQWCRHLKDKKCPKISGSPEH